MHFCRLDLSSIWNILLVLILPNFYSYIIHIWTAPSLIAFGLGLIRDVWSRSHHLVASLTSLKRLQYPFIYVTNF